MVLYLSSWNQKKWALRLKYTQYKLIVGVLFRRNYDVLLKCLEKSDAKGLLDELHNGPIVGNFGGETTSHKVLRAFYYWPDLFKDGNAYARKWKVCQTFKGREKKLVFPLQIVMVEGPFEQ